MPDDVFDVPGADELYDLEPAAFVAARDDLARRLRTDGDRAAGAAVKKLPKPTVAAWAVNQVARRRPDDVDALLRLGAAIREGQAAALTGGGAAALREATAERRSMVRALAAAAAALAGDAHADEVAATLEAASTDEDHGEVLRRGRLAKALPATAGFGFAGMPDVPTAVPERSEPDRELLGRLAGEVARSEEAVAEQEGRVREAEERVAEAERLLDEARTALAGAVSARDRAVAALAAAG